MNILWSKPGMAVIISDYGLPSVIFADGDTTYRALCFIERPVTGLANVIDRIEGRVLYLEEMDVT